MALTRRVNAIAVIGANYGDEGKGAVVNALSRQYKPEYVIRFNGGGQAGHTVQLKDGTRHVFSAFGSGTFYGAKTYYTEDALFSPKRYKEERLSLSNRGIKLYPPLLADDTRIVTDWDIALNQLSEVFRSTSSGAHGSCGMGIGECVFRNIRKPGSVKLTAGWKADRPALKDYFQRRALELIVETGVDLATNETARLAYEAASHHALSKYVQWADDNFGQELHEKVWDVLFEDVPFPFSSIEPTVIFEGAQGLLLDEDDPDHQPHVTWSKTGLTNVIKECKKHGWHLSQVHYVTRPYLTRHGAGPMHAADPHATIPWKDGLVPVDLTNVDNKWQGNLRYAAMDWDKFGARVNKDFRLAIDAWPEDPPQLSIHFTCFDQMEHMWTPPPLTAPDVAGGWLVSTNGLEG